MLHASQPVLLQNVCQLGSASAMRQNCGFAANLQEEKEKKDKKSKKAIRLPDKHHLHMRARHELWTSSCACAYLALVLRRTKSQGRRSQRTFQSICLRHGALSGMNLADVVCRRSA